MVGDGMLIPWVHLVKLVNTAEQTPLSADSRVLASMMNSLLSSSLTMVIVRPTAQLALLLVYTVHCKGLIIKVVVLDKALDSDTEEEVDSVLLPGTGLRQLLLVDLNVPHGHLAQLQATIGSKPDFGMLDSCWKNY